MADNLELSQEESNNLREELEKVQTDLAGNPERRTSFFSHPFKYLREGYNILLIGRIADFKDKIDDFNEAVRSIFNRIGEIINECFACKLASLIIIYGLLSKYAIAVSGFLEVADQIVSKLEEFFGGTGDRANEWLERVKKAYDDIKPSTLALRFCHSFGYCRQPL